MINKNDSIENIYSNQIAMSAFKHESSWNQNSERKAKYNCMLSIELNGNKEKSPTAMSSRLRYPKGLDETSGASVTYMDYFNPSIDK